MIAAGNVVREVGEVTVSRPISGDMAVSVTAEPVDLALITILSRERRPAPHAVVDCTLRLIDPSGATTWERHTTQTLDEGRTQRFSTEVCSLVLDRPGQWWLDLEITGGQRVSVPVQVIGLVPIH